MNTEVKLRFTPLAIQTLMIKMKRKKKEKASKNRFCQKKLTKAQNMRDITESL